MRRGAAAATVPAERVVLPAGVAKGFTTTNTLFVSAFPEELYHQHPGAGGYTPGPHHPSPTLLVLLPESMDNRSGSATPIGGASTHRALGQTAEIGAGGQTTQAKRRLELETDPSDLPSDVGGISKMPATSPTTAAHRRKQAKSNATTRPALQGVSRPTPTRHDTSLGLMTHRFLQLLARSHTGTVDLNVASRELNVSKRRLYDITNVLEGVQLLKKQAKNNMQWMGCHLQLNGDHDVSYSTVDPPLHGEMERLHDEERRLDELIQGCVREAKEQYQDTPTHRFAYMTHEDFKKIPCLKEQTMIVIKAPDETKVEVAHPDECFQVHLRSHQGPIEVYLCSDDCTASDSGGFHDGLSNTKDTASSFKVSSPDGANRSHRHNGRSDGFSSPSSGRTDQSSPLSLSVASSSSSSSSPYLAPTCLTPLRPHTPSDHQQTFVTLAAPLNLSLAGSDYLLGMGKDEGITDLFSSVLL